jgi:CheY-like chemotaxis protein
MKRILLVEDNLFSSGFFRTVLEQQAFVITTAASAETGLRLLTSSEFDLLLVDIRLPGMRGDEFIRQVYALHPQLPIIVISGAGDFDAEELMNLGVRKVLIKPLTNQELLSAVCSLAPTEPV